MSEVDMLAICGNKFLFNWPLMWNCSFRRNNKGRTSGLDQWICWQSVAINFSLTDLSCETVPLGETIKEGWVEWICWHSVAIYPSLTDLSCETVPLGETIKEGWVECICWQSVAIYPSLTDLSCETVPLGETIKERWVKWICWQSAASSYALDTVPLKVHKIENFFGFDFEICTFS